VAIYHDGVVNVEVGVEAETDLNPTGDVARSTISGGTVATTTHIGSYGESGAAHDAVASWCARNSRKLAGPGWEIYGHPTDDPAQSRTDVFHLLLDSTQ